MSNPQLPVNLSEAIAATLQGDGFSHELADELAHEPLLDPPLTAYDQQHQMYTTPPTVSRLMLKELMRQVDVKPQGPHVLT